jgi:pSer/pThr/pTyr-binding forkhead associated (FHA) protein
MEPSHEPLPDAADPSPPGGELVVQNGRAGGTRRPLNVPMTLIGRSAGCDVRLNADGVEPLHCALVHGPDGLLLRDLGGTSTLVNDVPADTVLLRDGDALTVGPFQFVVRLPEAGPAAGAALRQEQEAQEREREALRVQAAAVVAQQAALTETEGRLEQRRLALERQEEQLAAHLEAKRGRLLELQQRIRESRMAVQRERADHAARTAAESRELARLRQEVNHGQEYLQSRRRWLGELRRRLKRRYHEQVAAEREALRRRDEELTEQRQRLERTAAQLEQDRAAQAQARLRCNGEVELGRRQLHACWEELQRQQRRWQEDQARQQAELQHRQRDLEQRALVLEAAEHDLAGQGRHWERTRARLQREVEGLETRIRNCRRKLADEQLRFGPDPRDPADAPTVLIPAPAGTDAPPRPGRVEPPEAQLAELERLTGELADQRLQLAELCERLALAQDAWRREYLGVFEELEASAVRLQERERAVALREETLAPREFALHQRQEEAARLRQHLDAWLARVAAREAAWEGERERLLDQVQAREALTQRQWLAMVELRRRWSQRRRHELKRVRADLERCAGFRRQYAMLWEECARRRAELEQKERALAERALALEQYRLEYLGQAPDSAAANKRLGRLRRRWAGVVAAAERGLRRERRALEAEAARFRDQAEEVEQRLAEAAQHEEDVARRLADWEHEQALAEDGSARLRRELQSLQVQRALYERQLEQVRDEVERVARSLLDAPEPPPLTIAQAA